MTRRVCWGIKSRRQCCWLPIVVPPSLTFSHCASYHDMMGSRHPPPPLFSLSVLVSVPFPSLSPFPPPYLLPVPGGWLSPRYGVLKQAPGLATGPTGYLQASPPLCRGDTECRIIELITKTKETRRSRRAFSILSTICRTRRSASLNYASPVRLLIS